MIKKNKQGRKQYAQREKKKARNAGQKRNRMVNQRKGGEELARKEKETNKQYERKHEAMKKKQREIKE